MRRILIAVLILLLPTSVAVVVYFLSKPKVVLTSRDAVAQVATIAGTGSPGVGDGVRLEAGFSDPFGIVVDRRGEVIISDGGQGNRIRKITAEGQIKTIAGSTEGYGDGPALSASFNTPSGIAADKDANIIIADTSNNRIRKLSSDHTLVTTIAGSGAAGHKDGAALEAEFDGPLGVAVDRQGNIFVADTYNDRIRKISTDGEVTTIAGAAGPGFADGPGAAAQFNTPSGIAIDARGNLFVADTGNGAVRKITPEGDVSTIIKDEQAGAVAQPQFRVQEPVGIAITHDGFLFVADHSGCQVLRITPDWQVSLFAGSRAGYRDGPGARAQSVGEARFNGPAGIALDQEGNLFVADSQNYLIRLIASVAVGQETTTEKPAELFIQSPARPVQSNPERAVPDLDPTRVKVSEPFPWPLAPQDQPREVTGVVGEARGAPGGVALHHIHSGLDIRGNMGEAVLSVMDEKVASPIPAWGFGGSNEGVAVGLMSYIHIRVGRNAKDEIRSPEKFKPVIDADGKLAGVRIRRGTRLRVGDFVGTLNSLYHVHLNYGPWGAQANPIRFPFPGLADTVAPTIEPDGIEVFNTTGQPFKQKRDGRLVISGDVDIVVTAYDRVDGNASSRKLGLYRAGYQLLDEGGSPVAGFEQPLVNIEFNRLPPDDESVFIVYAQGSGVSAYGTPTKFKYIVTNKARDGRAEDGLLRTGDLAPGNYTIRVEAADYAGNRAGGKTAELAVVVERASNN